MSTTDAQKHQMIVWNDSLSLNIAEVDAQHQNLVNFINSLWQALLERRDQEVVAKLMDDLADYTVSHFGDEETFMRNMGYPNLAAHCEAHRSFVERVQQAVEDHEQGLAVGMELLRFLNDWLIHHIQVIDRQYADYSRQHAKGAVFSRIASFYKMLVKRDVALQPDVHTALSALDMQKTIDTHTVWLDRLRDYVKGQESSDYHVADVGQEDLCLLGNWLKLYSSQGWNQYAEFQSLQESHRQFHQIAAAVVAARQSGDVKTANHLLRHDLRTRSNEVRVHIVRLYAAAKD
jgi:hemerythrin